jgi:hypothetical protein
MRTVALWCCAAVLLWPVAGLADDHVVLLDDDVDFSTFRTFMVQSVSITSRHQALSSPVVERLLRDASAAALTARGLTNMSTQPALIVDCRVRGVDFDIDRMGRPVEQRAGRGGRPRQPNPNRPDFVEGTLVIDILRADTRALVWRGVYHDTDPDPAKVGAALPRHAAKLLSQFPRQKKP